MFDKENLSDDLESTHVYSFQDSNINFSLKMRGYQKFNGAISNFGTTFNFSLIKELFPDS